MKGIFGDSTWTLVEAVTIASMPTVILDSSESSKLNERVTSFENSGVRVTGTVEPALSIVCESSWMLPRPFGAETALKLNCKSRTVQDEARQHWKPPSPGQFGAIAEQQVLEHSPPAQSGTPFTVLSEHAV